MTRSSPPGVLVLACLMFASPPALQAQSSSAQPAATVRLSAQRDTTLTAADLARLPRSRIQTAPHDGDTSHAQVLEEAAARTPTPRLLLADRRNGQPLSPDEGPFRVIAPDARHSRWNRQVVRIAVRAAAP